MFDCVCLVFLFLRSFSQISLIYIYKFNGVLIARYIPDTKTEEKENKSAISSCPIALAHILNRLIVYFGVDYGWLLNGKSTKLYHLFFGMFVFK